MRYLQQALSNTSSTPTWKGTFHISDHSSKKKIQTGLWNPLILFYKKKNVDVFSVHFEGEQLSNKNVDERLEN